MKKLILATASVLALGLATSGASFAQQPGGAAQPPQSNEMNQPSANMPAGNMPAENNQNQAPNAGMQPGMQQGAQAQPGEQSTAPVHVSQQQVRQIQQQLKTAGLYKGGIDGILGPETRQAIAKFQQKNGLQNTGKLDQQTLAALTNNGTGGEGSNMAPNTQPSNAGNNNETNNPSPQPGANGNMNQPANPNQQ